MDSEAQTGSKSTASVNSGRLRPLEPDWTKKCIVCEDTPIVTGWETCGPCTFGDASTVKGNWDWEGWEAC